MICSARLLSRIRSSRRKCICWKTAPRRSWCLALWTSPNRPMRPFSALPMRVCIWCARRPRWRAGPIWPCKEERVDNCRHRRHDPGWTGNPSVEARGGEAFPKRVSTMPIIQSLLDTDFYKFTMGHWVFKRYPNVPVRYAFKNRTARVQLAESIDEAELRRELDHVRTLRVNPSE